MIKSIIISKNTERKAFAGIISNLKREYREINKPARNPQGKETRFSANELTQT